MVAAPTLDSALCKRQNEPIGGIMKFIIIALLALPAYAANDSVAVFLRPEKSVILINERGADSRLQRLIKAFGPDKELLWESPDKVIRLNCARNDSAATCTIRLLPSINVQIENKRVFARAPIEGVSDLDLTWESSRYNRFNLRIAYGSIDLTGQKP